MNAKISRPTPAQLVAHRRPATAFAALAVALLLALGLPSPSWAATKVPTGLQATSVSSTSINLSWSKVSGAPKYRIAYSTRSSMSGAVYRRFVSSPAAITGLEPGRKYYIKVRVITTDGGNLSSYSPAITATTSPSRPVSEASSAPLRVGSYNIRCANCSGGLTWAQRRGAVVDTIKGERLDVLGVQEASQGWLKDANGSSYELSQFEDLQRRLGSPWALTNSKRNNCQKHTTPTNCVRTDQGASQGTKIFYNTATVDLLDNGSTLLPSKDATTNARYVAWAILRQEATGRKFFFADVHLEPGSGEYSLRQRQAATALRTINAENPDNLPAILAGDFNSSRFAKPSNTAYDTFRAGGFADPLGQVAETTKTAPGAFVEKRINTDLNSFNDFERQAKRARSGWLNGSYIDYLMVAPKMRVSEWENVADLDADDRYVGVIPSDHNLIRMTVHLG